MEYLQGPVAAPAAQAPIRCAEEHRAPLAPQPVAAFSGLRDLGAQPSLRVGSVEDPTEVEAETVARRVTDALRAPDGFGRAPARIAPLGQGAIARLRRTGSPAGAAGGAVDGVTEQELRAERGRGRPLDQVRRGQLEPIMGTDLSAVRLHEGDGPRRLNEAIGAKAFTLGQDIYFRDGVPEPGMGDHLLAHELTHTVQQRPQGAVSRRISRFYAVVDKPTSGKKYETVGERPYEWIEDKYWDERAYRKSTIKTGWKWYDLYERAPQGGTSETESEGAQTEEKPADSHGPTPKGNAPTTPPPGGGRKKRKNTKRTRPSRRTAPSTEESGAEEEQQPEEGQEPAALVDPTAGEDGGPGPEPDAEPEVEAEAEVDDGLPKADQGYTLAEARGRLRDLHPLAPGAPGNRKAAAEAWGRYVLDELQVSRNKTKKSSTTDPMPGQVRETYKTRFDTGVGEFSASLSVKNVPEVVIHAHMDAQGDPKPDMAVHWKWADLDRIPESYELSEKARKKFVTVKGANKHWERNPNNK